MTDIVTLMQQIRAALMDFTADVPDDKAVKYPALFDPWKKDTTYAEGDRREYNGTLYKCRQDHMSQEIYPPNLIPALWTPVNATNAGTLEDPIPAERGMEYVYGKHYLDPEDGKIYKCSRVGAADGETIILQYLPHELVGQYFDEVSGDEN